jgi:predicted RNase H-like HicB family nuclease
MALSATRESTTTLAFAPSDYNATVIDVWPKSVEITGGLAEDLPQEVHLTLDFDDEPVEVLRGIPVAVEAVDDGYVATFTEAGIAMAGDTMEDAMSDLKSWLVDVFEHLTEMPTERLGPDLIRKREVLQTYMRRVE